MQMSEIAWNVSKIVSIALSAVHLAITIGCNLMRSEPYHRLFRASFLEDHVSQPGQTDFCSTLR